MKIKSLEVRQSEKQKKQSLIHSFLFYITEKNSELSQTSKVDLFGKTVNGLMLLSLFEQSSILDVTRL